MNKDAKLPETEEGAILFNVDPIIVKHHYEIDYIHSYAQDSPFFAGLAKKKLLGSRCTECGRTYATPRGHCMECGAATAWFELPREGRVHTYTTCHFGGEAFYLVPYPPRWRGAGPGDGWHAGPGKVPQELHVQADRRLLCPGVSRRPTARFNRLTLYTKLLRLVGVRA